MKKLIETLSNDEQIALLSGTIEGVFTTLFKDTDSWYSDTYEICLGYYTENSATKPISSTFQYYIDMIAENSSLGITANELMGNYLRGKYIEKWSRIYTALLNTEYNVLTEYEESKNISGENHGQKVYNTTNAKTGTNQDKKTYDTNETDDTNTNTSMTTTNNDNNVEEVYGFNSSNGVNSNESNATSSQVTSGNSEDNFTNTQATKTGTETNDITINESDKKTGTDKEDKTNEESVTLSGRKTSPIDLIKKELDLRSKYIFYDIVYKDLDEVLTLKIY